MKYTIVITQVIEEKREVEVDTQADLEALLQKKGQFIGKCIQPSKSKELVGRVFDEQGKSLGTVDFDAVSH